MNRLIAFFILLVMVVGSCTKTNNPGVPPVIGFITDSGMVSNDTTLQLGGSYRIGLSAFGEDYNLTNLIIKIETSENEVFLDTGMNTPALKYYKTIVKGPAISERWTFIIRDRDGQSSQISHTISLDTNTVAYGDITEYENISLGAQFSEVDGFMSLTNGNTYNMEEAYDNQGIIDLCYYYDVVDTDENTISSPGGNISEQIFSGEFWPGNWEVRITTRFKTTELTIDNFEAANNDSLLIAAYGTTDGKRKAKNMKTGDIFSFRNSDGLIGLFHVETVEGQENGSVNISIKIQKQ